MVSIRDYRPQLFNSSICLFTIHLQLGFTLLCFSVTCIFSNMFYIQLLSNKLTSGEWGPLNSWFLLFSPGRGLRISATTQGSMAMVVCGWMAKDPTRVSLYWISSPPSSFFLLSSDPGSDCVWAQRGWSLIGSSLGLTSKQMPSMLLIKEWGTRCNLIKNIKNTKINEAGGSVKRYIEGVWYIDTQCHSKEGLNVLRCLFQTLWVATSSILPFAGE